MLTLNTIDEIISLMDNHVNPSSFYVSNKQWLKLKDLKIKLLLGEIALNGIV